MIRVRQNSILIFFATKKAVSLISYFYFYLLLFTLSLLLFGCYGQKSFQNCCLLILSRKKTSLWLKMSPMGLQVRVLIEIPYWSFVLYLLLFISEYFVFFDEIPSTSSVGFKYLNHYCLSFLLRRNSIYVWGFSRAPSSKEDFDKGLEK